MSQLRLSIAMCTYNGEKFLKDQLESIKEQTQPPFELIICDDASSDNTINIIEEYLSTVNYPVYIYKNEINIGATKNYDKAISLCKGDIIILADQDDIWDKGKLEVIKKVFENNKSVGAIFTDAIIIDENLKTRKYSLWETFNFTKYEKYQFKCGKALNVLLKHNVVTGATLAFKRDYISIILPIPISWIHDAWIAIIIASISNICILNKPLIKYRLHKQQLIGIPHKTIYDEIQIAKTANYLYEAEYIQLLYDRLIQYKHIIHNKRVFTQIKEKINHKIRRAMLPKNIFNRLIIISKEISNLNYFKYSFGIKSIYKDIFLY